MIITIPLFLAVAWMQSREVGAQWEFLGWDGVEAAAAAFIMVAVMVLAEELLFRGVALRNLRALVGDTVAIVLLAMLFGAYHLAGTEYWGMGAVFRFLMPAIGGLLFGWAAVRSG